MAEQGDSKKSSGPAKTPPAPVPKPSSAPATGNADEAKYKAARDQVFEKADSDSLDNYLGTLLQSCVANPLYSHTVITQDGSHRDLLDAITLVDAKETPSPWSPRVRHPSISTLSGP